MAALRQLEVTNIIRSIKVLMFFHITYHISCTFAGTLLQAKQIVACGDKASVLVKSVC